MGLMPINSSEEWLIMAFDFSKPPFWRASWSVLAFYFHFYTDRGIGCYKWGVQIQSAAECGRVPGIVVWEAGRAEDGGCWVDTDAECRGRTLRCLGNACTTIKTPYSLHWGHFSGYHNWLTEWSLHSLFKLSGGGGGGDLYLILWGHMAMVISNLTSTR